MILRSLSVVVLMALVVPSFAQAEALSSVAPMCGVKPSAEDISGSLGSPVHLLSNNHRRSNAVVLDSLPPGLEQDCNGLLLINSREYKMQ